MSATSKQAVLLIHGIGEQRPMDTLRGFVRTMWMTDASVQHPHAKPGVFSKPDDVSGNYELRRLTTTQDRNGVRTPMQWTEGRHGGFSAAPEEASLVRPVICEGDYGIARVNVADQQRDPASLLNWMQRAIGIRRGCPELSWGDACALDVADPSVLAICSAMKERSIFCLHNLSERPTDVQVDFGLADGDQLTEIFGDREYPPVSDGRVTLAVTDLVDEIRTNLHVYWDQIYLAGRQWRDLRPGEHRSFEIVIPGRHTLLARNTAPIAVSGTNVSIGCSRPASEGRTALVECVTLDSTMNDVQHVGLIHMDAEGSEHK